MRREGVGAATRRVRTMVGLIVVFGLGCGDPAGPTVDLTLVGTVQVWPDGGAPVYVQTTARTGTDCDNGPVVGEASGTMNPDGTYRMSMEVTTSAPVCISATALFPDHPDYEAGTVSAQVRQPVPEGEGEISLPKIPVTIRVVISRPAAAHP